MATNTTAFIVNTPTINISSGPIDVKCVARSARLTPDDAVVDVGVFCDPRGERKGATQWTFETTLLLSYDSADGAGDGVWNQLHALRKTIVTFELLPQDGVAVSSANPKASGSIEFPSIPFADWSPGEKVEIPISTVVIGDPAFATAA